jgi:hypothetical protein
MVSEFFESPDDFEDLLEEAERQASVKWAVLFVTGIRKQYNLRGAKTPLTSHQLATLRALIGE